MPLRFFFKRRMGAESNSKAGLMGWHLNQLRRAMVNAIHYGNDNRLLNRVQYTSLIRLLQDFDILLREEFYDAYIEDGGDSVDDEVEFELRR
jgi:hypothetical protein